MAGEPRYEIKSGVSVGPEGQSQRHWYWTLQSANGEILSTSETYTTRESAEKGIEAAKRASAESGE